MFMLALSIDLSSQPWAYYVVPIFMQRTFGTIRRNTCLVPIFCWWSVGRMWESREQGTILKLIFSNLSHHPVKNFPWLYCLKCNFNPILYCFFCWQMPLPIHWILIPSGKMTLHDDPAMRLITSEVNSLHKLLYRSRQVVEAPAPKIPMLKTWDWHKTQKQASQNQSQPASIKRLVREPVWINKAVPKVIFQL